MAQLERAIEEGAGPFKGGARGGMGQGGAVLRSRVEQAWTVRDGFEGSCDDRAQAQQPGGCLRAEGWSSVLGPPRRAAASTPGRRAPTRALLGGALARLCVRS